MDLSLGDSRLIVDACKSHGVLRNQAAYVLATAFHESAHTMKPVREYGGETYLRAKPYYPFVGMGYVQLTWERNYKKASDKLGVDFVKNPRLLLDPQYAAPVLVIGMVEGWFTGKSLSSYITLSASDFVNARRIINGTDRADLIAGYAHEYDALLLKDGYGLGVSQAAPPVITPKPSIPAASQPEKPPVVIAPAPPSPRMSKPAAAASGAVLLAAAIAGFWHHITAFVSNLF